MPPYGTSGSVTMSRSSSQTVPDMHARPPSSIGHHPAPTMTPQPQTLVSPPQPSTPGPPPSPYGVNRPAVKKPPTKAIEIKNPDTGATVKIDKPAPSPATPGAPVIVSSPSPVPGRASSRDAPQSRDASRSKKSNEEKRNEMREKVREEAKKAEEDQRRRKEEEARKAEEERKRKEEEAEAERKRKEEEEKAKKEAEEKARIEAEEKAKREAEEKARQEEEAREKARQEAEEKARLEAERAEAEAKAKEEEEERAKKEAEEKARLEEEAAKAAEAKAQAEKEALSATPTPATKGEAEPSMPPPPRRPKPGALNLTNIKTNEPALPSAALTSLRSARPVDNLKHLQYPEGIQSPNPALNPLANTTKFKYDKDFLMQFQTVFTEKPSIDWDQRMRDTVGDSESSRSGTARTPLGVAPRSASRSGTSGLSSMGGAMGAFGSFNKPASSSMGFQKSSSSNSLAGILGGMGRPTSLMRTGSSTSLAGSSNAIPQSPRNSNRSARSSKRGGGGGGGTDMARSDSRQGPSQPTIPLADVKPLPVSANRWKPRSVADKSGAAGDNSAPNPEENRMDPDMVQRKVKAALNKMTPEKFDKISDQILEITAQSKYESDGRTLRQVIQLTFEKATDEAHWASMYAKFCKRMLETMDPNIKDENIRDKMGNVVTGGNLFRKYLLNRCQEEFERGWKVNLPPKPEGISDEATMLSDEYYIAAAAKRRGLGLVQFIGELFKLGMLTERIMNECVRKLLDFEGIPEDETVESLTKLLRTIGAQLDASEKSKPMMDMYFQRIQSMIDNKELNSRMRFMLMDVVDLRKTGWRSKETNKGPKTLQEVHEEALKAQQEKEAQSRANRGNRPQAGRGDARSFSQGGYGNMMHPPGGYHDNKSAGTLNPDELRKLSARSSLRSSGTSGPTFGPGSMLGRTPSGGGSRRGNTGRDDSGPNSRTATPPGPASTSTPNRFSSLQVLGNDAVEGNDAVSPPGSAAPSPQISSAKLDRARSPSGTPE